MTYPNVALTGKLRSGKDAVAAYLSQHYGYTRFAFGDELKRDFHRRYPEISREPKPRVGYQTHGQLMRKLIGEDVWVRYLFDKIDAIDAADTVIGVDLRAIITDLRQPNEYERCRAECYVIIRVSCPDDIRLERARSAGDVFTAEDLRHETESYVDTFAVDYEIDNSGSLAELYAKVDEVMAKINVRKTEGIR